MVKPEVRIRGVSCPGDLDSAAAFFKGHGLRDVVRLAWPHLAPVRKPITEFFEVEVSIGDSAGLYGPVEFPVARAIGKLSRLGPFLDAIESKIRTPRSPLPFKSRIGGVLDCAIWDLTGKNERRSVGEITATGSPVSSVRCYASMISVDIDGPETAAIAKLIADLGFWGQKWTLPEGTSSGDAGIVRNVKRVEKLRGAVGPDNCLMFETHERWSPDYFEHFVKMAKELNIFWIEDPFPISLLTTYVTPEGSTIRICAGEKLRSFESFQPLIQAEADFIVQPDVLCCGGYTVAGLIKDDCIGARKPLALHGRHLVPSFHLAAFAPPDFPIALEYNPIFEPERQNLMKVRSKIIPSEEYGSLDFDSTHREGLWERI